MPDPEQRHRYAIELAEELAQFERPMPVVDEYDLRFLSRVRKARAGGNRRISCMSPVNRLRE